MPTKRFEPIKLTPAQYEEIKTAKAVVYKGRLEPVTLPKLPPGKYSDGNGLYFKVSEDGRSRCWTYRQWVNGKATERGLGSFAIMPVIHARWLARHLQHRHALGQELPKELKPVNTFESCAEAYIKARAPKWKNAKHAGQWRTTLETYAYPVIGGKDIATLAVKDVLAVLNKDNLWANKNVTARRVLNRIQLVIQSAISLEQRTDQNNPARWEVIKGTGLDDSAPEPKKHEAMPLEELPGFFQALDNSAAARALRFLILTAARRGEVVGDDKKLPASWSEIDLANKVWTVPAERMGKTKKAHRVALSQGAIEALGETSTGAIFPIAEKAMNKLIPGEATVHGMRACFSTWAYKQKRFASEEIEDALAHTVGNKVSRAYNRDDMLERRRELMNAWENYLITKSDR